MTTLDIFFLFMITTSLTLTGFVIRQRKHNRMLGELVAQNKVDSRSGYSKLDVGVKNKEYVSKCPACAEWISLEAKVCKSCQRNVLEHNLGIRESMKQIDDEIKQSELDLKAYNRDRRKALLKNPIFRVLMVLVIAFSLFISVVFIQSSIRYRQATALPSNAYSLIKSWNSIVVKCDMKVDRVGTPKAELWESTGTVTLQIDLTSDLVSFDWNSSLGKQIICFSENALAINVSEKLDPNSVNNIDLRNGYSIFGDQDTSYISFYWS